MIVFGIVEAILAFNFICSKHVLAQQTELPQGKEGETSEISGGKAYFRVFIRTFNS